LSPDTCFGFCEFSRRAGDFALAMVLAGYRLKDGAMTNARVGVGGAEGRPRRIAQAEAALNGRQLGAAAFSAAADAAAAATDGPEDYDTSADYRRDLVRAMTYRALERAA